MVGSRRDRHRRDRPFLKSNHCQSKELAIHKVECFDYLPLRVKRRRVEMASVSPLASVPHPKSRKTQSKSEEKSRELHVHHLLGKRRERLSLLGKLEYSRSCLNKSL